MWVHAFWLVGDKESFTHCCGVEGTIALPQPDAVAGVRPEPLPGSRFYEPLSWPPGSGRNEGQRWKEMLDAGPPVLAALCLGSTGASYYADTEGYFTCTPNDLTDEGQSLLTTASQLYNRQPGLVTYLDT